jgi:hypothetical protein
VQVNKVQPEVTFNRIIEVYRKVRRESIPPPASSTFSNLR